MLTIRLKRVGKTKFATYRLIISEKGRDTQARYQEVLGNYNPHDKENGLVLKQDRIKYWLSKGAQASNTVFNLFLKSGLVAGKKKRSVKISQKRAKKIEAKKADEAKKEAEAKAKAQASKAEAEAKPVAEETPQAE